MGHRAGTNNIRRVLQAATEHGIKVLTIYAFSTENWGRPPAEVRGLMQLLSRTIRDQLKELNENGVQIRHSGSLVGISDTLRRQILEALEMTRDVYKRQARGQLNALSVHSFAANVDNQVTARQASQAYNRLAAVGLHAATHLVLSLIHI